MKKICILLLCLGLVGCKTLLTFNDLPENSAACKEGNTAYVYDGTYGTQTSSCFYKKYEINIISDPPGAKIEWNNEYIGEAPCKKIINGTFNLYSNPIAIVANPVLSGQFVQTKVLSQEPLPKTIYFNMALGPVTPAVDVNVNQGGHN